MAPETKTLAARTAAKVLFTREQIAQRVREMGAEITSDFRGQDLVLVGVLKGAAVFLSDLARAIDLDATFDFVGAASYGEGLASSGAVRLTKGLDQPVAGKNVILVEDILDSGLTLAFLKSLLNEHPPKALRVAALLDKPSRRQADLHADYVGFEIPDVFVVGYGMDHAERYRNLPDIVVLPEAAG